MWLLGYPKLFSNGLILLSQGQGLKKNKTKCKLAGLILFLLLSQVFSQPDCMKIQIFSLVG